MTCSWVIVKIRKTELGTVLYNRVTELPSATLL